MLMFSQADVERRNLFSKYRRFWTYFEDEKWRYASWEMLYFIAFSFGYTRYQNRPRGSRAFRLSSRTIDERFRKIFIFVCWLTPKYTPLLLTHFRKSSSMPIVTTGACAVVTRISYDTANKLTQNNLLNISDFWPFLDWHHDVIWRHYSFILLNLLTESKFPSM